MKFDRRAPGEGVEAVCRLENGRIIIEWRFSFSEAKPEELHDILYLTMCDKKGQAILFCMQEAKEEETLVSVVLHPHLWSCQDPYLYEVEAVLQDSEGKEIDRLKKQLPLRELYFHPRRGWMLNEEEIVLKAVEYIVPQHTSRSEKQQLILKDFGLLKAMGANCIHAEASLWKLCEKSGFLIWRKEMAIAGEELPCLAGEGSSRLASLFYQYKAKWCKEPFVYIVPESISILPSGNLKATVYSNCNRVVLYSDGILFEFQSGKEEFTFLEIPAKGPCVMLSAEGEDCSVSLSFHKTFTKLSRNNDISRLE